MLVSVEAHEDSSEDSKGALVPKVVLRQTQRLDEDLLLFRHRVEETAENLVESRFAASKSTAFAVTEAIEKLGLKHRVRKTQSAARLVIEHALTISVMRRVSEDVTVDLPHSNHSSTPVLMAMCFALLSLTCSVPCVASSQLDWPVEAFLVTWIVDASQKTAR